MKILFICGCLEPGRDGVGDYVQRLSEELIRLNHHPYALAINDSYVTSSTLSSQIAGTPNLSALRLPSAWNKKRRLEQAKLWMDVVDPDLVSIQYVPFSFHRKGLPFSLGRDIKEIAGDRAIHMMVHETWVRVSHSLSVKQQLYAFLQKQVLRRTVKNTTPSIIHSHLPAYRNQVEKLGFKVLPLPLFSNIPLVQVQTVHEEKIFRIGLLSQATPTDAVIDFLKDAVSVIHTEGLQVEVLLIGGSEERMKAYSRRYEQIPGLRGKVVQTGFLSDKDVSASIQTCNLGLTPVPRHLLGKSGSVAAFLTHGIPVAAPEVHQEVGAHEIGFFSPAVSKTIVLEPDYTLFTSAHKDVLAVRREIKLSNIVQVFTRDIDV